MINTNPEISNQDYFIAGRIYDTLHAARLEQTLQDTDNYTPTTISPFSTDQITRNGRALPDATKRMADQLLQSLGTQHDLQDFSKLGSQITKAKKHLSQTDLNDMQINDFVKALHQGVYQQNVKSLDLLRQHYQDLQLPDYIQNLKGAAHTAAAYKFYRQHFESQTGQSFTSDNFYANQSPTAHEAELHQFESPQSPVQAGAFAAAATEASPRQTDVHPENSRLDSDQPDNRAGLAGLAGFAAGAFASLKSRTQNLKDQTSQRLDQAKSWTQDHWKSATLATSAAVVTLAIAGACIAGEDQNRTRILDFGDRNTSAPNEIDLNNDIAKAFTSNVSTPTPDHSKAPLVAIDSSDVYIPTPHPTVHPSSLPLETSEPPIENIKDTIEEKIINPIEEDIDAIIPDQPIPTLEIVSPEVITQTSPIPTPIPESEFTIPDGEPDLPPDAVETDIDPLELELHEESITVEDTEHITQTVRITETVTVTQTLVPESVRVSYIIDGQQYFMECPVEDPDQFSYDCPALEIPVKEIEVIREIPSEVERIIAPPVVIPIPIINFPEHITIEQNIESLPPVVIQETKIEQPPPETLPVTGDSLSHTQADIYIVKAHDTLSQIFKANYHFAPSREQLNSFAQANNLTNPDLIHIGDTLILPNYTNESTNTNLPDSTIPSSYTVKPGDNLRQIWIDAIGTEPTSSDLLKLAEVNNIPHPDRIYPGQTIRFAIP